MDMNPTESSALTEAAEKFKPAFKNVAVDHPPKQHQCPSRQPWRLVSIPASPKTPAAE
jgi:hypothetical protein